MVFVAGVAALSIGACSESSTSAGASSSAAPTDVSMRPASVDGAPTSNTASQPMPSPSPAWTGTVYGPTAGRVKPAAAALTALGRALFFEPALSASGKTACATCHDSRFGYGPPNARSVQLAGPDGTMPGTRATPSLRYLQSLPPFSEHFFENEGDDSVDAGPTGGHDWDGRASSAHEQALVPLLSANEMANGSVDAVVTRLETSPVADLFRRTFGADAFKNRQAAFDGAMLALEAFQQSPEQFYPYSSRYDAVLRGQAKLTDQEARGLQWFDDPAKGNCAACHRSRVSPDGAFPAFTDFGHIALGVPRNRTLPANADPQYQDRGLCGPLRTDFTAVDDYCGRFRTPSLRNVAIRRAFFHNGAFHTLRDALRFYAKRDTDPALFYPTDAAGRVMKFDDLAPRYHANVNTEPPFGRRPGDKPALSDTEIDDVIAFLRTLTDADVVAQMPTAESKAAQTRH